MTFWEIFGHILLFAMFKHIYIIVAIIYLLCKDKKDSKNNKQFNIVNPNTNNYINRGDLL